MQKLKDLIKVNIKKIVISLAVTVTVSVTLFYVEMNIDTIQLADSIDINITTTINIH